MNEVILLDRSGLLGSKVQALDNSGHMTKGNDLMVETGNATNSFGSINGRRSLGMRKCKVKKFGMS